MYLVIFHHNDGGTVQFPDHSPEVSESGRNGVLCGNVAIGLVVGLEEKELDHLPELIE